MAVKVKSGMSDADLQELEGAEYEERESFSEYDGELPKRGTILRGRIKKAWIGQSQAGNEMLTLIWEAEGNGGSRKEFNGLGTWERLAFTPKAKFKWQPFLDLFGLKVSDVVGKANKLKSSSGEEGSIGIELSHINKLEIGSDGALCRVTTGINRARDGYEASASVSSWMPDEMDDEFGSESESETSGKGKKAAAKGGKKGKKGKGGDDTPF